MDWTGVGTLAAAITGLTGGGLGVASLVRTAREAGAKERADAASIGLEYLEKALNQQQATISTQQATITKQQGEIGELRGHLKSCQEERDLLSVRVTALEKKSEE